jgi:tetratricopeptide (TPR) repeat protein
MNRVIIFFAATVMAALICVPIAADSARPIAVVFPTAHGEGIDKSLADASTQALCNYLRETGRVDVVAFDRESPTVLRAIMDKELTADQVASYSNHQQRIDVAKALAYDYAASAEISVKDGVVNVKVWLAKARGGKKDQWEALGQSSVGGGVGELNFVNAMQSATSAAVVSVSRQGFLGLPAIDEKAASTPSDTIAITTDLVAPPAPPTASDYSGQADESLKAGNFAVAIQQYQQAVNADPTSPSLRLKLADAFARRGLYDEAISELNRAEALGADSEKLSTMRKQVDALRDGKPAPAEAAVASQPQTPTPDVETTQPTAEPDPAAPKPKADSKAAIAKMKLGDSLWRAAKVDEAAVAYKEAVALNPADWRAYERLALVNVSMSLYSEAKKALLQLSAVQPRPSSQIIATRYSVFTKVFEQSFSGLLKQYERDARDYQTQRIARESYYSSVKGLSYRVETMAQFLDVLTVPDDKKSMNLHLSLACGLVSQAASSLQDYLETNSADSKANAETFIAQAKKELETVHKALARSTTAQKPPAQRETQTAEPAGEGTEQAQPASEESGQPQQTQPVAEESDAVSEQQPDDYYPEPAPPPGPEGPYQAPPPPGYYPEW